MKPASLELGPLGKSLRFARSSTPSPNNEAQASTCAAAHKACPRNTGTLTTPSSWCASSSSSWIPHLDDHTALLHRHTAVAASKQEQPEEVLPAHFSSWALTARASCALGWTLWVQGELLSCLSCLSVIPTCARAASLLVAATHQGVVLGHDGYELVVACSSQVGQGDAKVARGGLDKGGLQGGLRSLG